MQMKHTSDANLLDIEKVTNSKVLHKYIFHHQRHVAEKKSLEPDTNPRSVNGNGRDKLTYHTFYTNL